MGKELVNGEHQSSLNEELSIKEIEISMAKKKNEHTIYINYLEKTAKSFGKHTDFFILTFEGQKISFKDLNQLMEIYIHLRLRSIINKIVGKSEENKKSNNLIIVHIN